jgi:hypothetical protein
VLFLYNAQEQQQHDVMHQQIIIMNNNFYMQREVIRNALISGIYYNQFQQR